jgi:hypothetical protein
VNLRTYLAQASPEEWHQVAWTWNGENGQDELRWIVRRPTCDRGTALLVYGGGAPRYFAQYATRDEVPEHELDGYNLVLDIERRYLAGAYTRQEIAFDPRGEYGGARQGTTLTARHTALPNRRPIPAAMYVATPERQLARAA